MNRNYKASYNQLELELNKSENCIDVNSKIVIKEKATTQELKRINVNKFARINFYDHIKEQLKFDGEGKCINTFETISDPRTLLLAYNTIKSNSGNMVKGADKETLDGINVPWFTETSRNLIEESWWPKPARRVYIPKPNGKMRPLGISSPRDKIVQQSMRMVLETLLEPKFSNLSHGFRPARGCHTALREVRDWKGVIWFIEGDIKGFFDNIDHHILEDLINKHVKDKRLINLYWKFVKAGYVEWDKSKVNFVSTDMGVPQGGILSPLLSNLVLHEFDRYIENMKDQMDTESKNLKPFVTNPNYHKLTMRINRLKKKMNALTGKELWNAKFEYVKTVKDRRKVKSIIPNPLVSKIKYVRYADDWLIGLWGSKQVAHRIKNLAKNYLTDLKLELSMEKTLITNAREERAKFLGTFIKRLASNKSTHYRIDKGRSRRVPTGNLWMTAPILELANKLEDKEFLVRKDHRWIPKSIAKFTALPVAEIIQRYNSIANGISNYYSFADNRRYLRKIIWILKESLRKTISRKLNVNKKTFTLRLGKKISTNIFNKQDKNTKTIRFTQIDYSRRPMHFLGDKIFKDPILSLIYKVSTISSFGMVCSSCGSSSNIEMHHVKHIKTINQKLNTFDKMMAKINRKQVPLCRNCHMEVHQGTYQGKSIKTITRFELI